MIPIYKRKKDILICESYYRKKQADIESLLNLNRVTQNLDLC